MKDTPPHLKTLEEIERGGIPGLVEVFRDGGIKAVRYALYDVPGLHEDYNPPTCPNRPTEEPKKVG